MKNKKVIQTLLIVESSNESLSLKHHFDKPLYYHYQLHYCDSLSSSLQFLTRNKVDLVILEVRELKDRELDIITKMNVSHPQLAIVVISETNDLNTKKLALLHGAEDCLTKENYNTELFDKTLTYALERKKRAFSDLGTGQNKEKELQIFESEKKFRFLTENIPYIFFSFSPEFEIDFMNSFGMKALGLNQAPKTFEEFQKAKHPDDVEKGNKLFPETIGKGKAFFAKVRLKMADGQYRWFTEEVIPYKNEKTGKVYKWIAIETDIHDSYTSQQRLQESEEKYRFLAESMPHILWGADPAGNINYLNRRGIEVFGLPFKKLSGDGWFSILHPDDVPQVTERWTQSVQKGIPYVNEQRLKIASGEYHWFNVSAKPEITEGKIVDWVGISTDIHIEKTSKMQLVENEQDMARGYEAAKIDRFQYDISKNEFTWTEGAKLIMQIGDEQGINTYKQLVNHTYFRDRIALEECFQSILLKGSSQLAFRVKSGKNAPIWIRIICNKIKDKARGIELVKGVVQDINESKLKEEAFFLSKQKLDNVINSVKDVVFTVDQSYRIMEVYGEDPDLLHKPTDKIIGQPVSKFFGGTNPELKNIYLNAFKNGEATYNYEISLKKSGQTKSYQIKLATLRNNKDKTIGLIGIARDMTDDIARTKELTNTKERLKGLVDNSPAILYEYDLNTGGVYYSEKVKHLFGYKKEELLDDPQLWANSILPEDQFIQKQALEDFKNNGHFNIQYRVKTKAGDIKWLRDICSGKDVHNPTLIRGVAIDITAEKQLLESVADSEKRYKRIYQNIDEGYLLLKKNGDILGMNPAGLEILGLAEKGKNAVYTKNFKSDILASDQRFNLIVSALEAVPKLEKEIMEVKTSRGAAKILTFNFSQVTAENDTSIIEGSFHDVTEDFNLSSLTAATNKIYESLDRLSRNELIQLGVDTYEELTNSRIAFFHLVNGDKNTIHLTEWSTHTKEVYQVPKLDAYSPINDDVIWAECIKTKQPIIHNAYQNKESLPEAFSFLSRDLQIPILEDGRVVGIIGVGNKSYEYTDLDVRQLQAFGATLWSILKRKDATEELKQTKNVLEQAQRIGNNGNWWADLRTGEHWWSDMMKEIHGLSADKPTPGEDYLEQINPEDLEERNQIYQQAFESGSYEFQYRVRRYNDNKEIIIQSSGNILYDQDKKPTHLLGVCRDVTDQVTLIDELVKSKEQLNLAIEGGKLAVLDHDLQKDSIHASELYFEIIGRTHMETFNHKFILENIVHPEDRTSLDVLFDEVFSGSVDQYNHSYRIIRPDNSIRYLQRIGKVLFDEDKKPYRSVGVVIDATNRRTLENQLLDSNRQITSLIESIPGLVFRCNINEGKLTPSFMSQYVETLSGYSEYDFIHSQSIGLNNLVHDQDFPEVFEQMKQAFNNKDKFEASFRIITQKGEIKWVSVRGNFISFNMPFLKSDLEGVMMDITDQVQSEEERLSIAMAVEDRERKRISQEIHDGLQQTLITALFNIESIRKEIDKLSDKYIQRYTDGTKYLNQGINETRGIAHSLMPKAVDDFGYVLAVRNILDNFNRDIDVNFVENIGDFRLKPEVELALFRITQEALTNINKYSKAKSVFIQLIYTDDNVNLSIEDDGVGFDYRKLMQKNKGMGLISMKNRATSVGGTFELNSSPSSGTFIMIDIPYKSAEE